MKNNIARILTKYFIPLMLFAGGIIFLILGTKEINIRKTYPEAEATVVSCNVYYEDSGEDRTEHVDTVAEFTVDGQTYSPLLNSSKRYDAGEKIIVLYNPNNPNDAYASGEKGYIAGIIFGAVLLLFGVFLNGRNLLEIIFALRK